jgi:4-amino-4-deoxy-L-arabinose transferase-like glycosyltransferase
VLLAAGIGLRDPWAPNEPRLILAALETLRHGLWLQSSVGGVLFAGDPPLYRWVLAGLFGLGGSGTFLVVSLLSAMATLLLVTDLAIRLWGRRVGLAAAYMMLVCVQFVLHAKSAQVDMFLTFWTTLSVYGLLRHLLLGPDWRYWYVGCAAVGFAVLTAVHGAVVLLIILPCFIARALRWKLPVFLGGWRWLLGVGLIALPPLLWLGSLWIFAGVSPEVAWIKDHLVFDLMSEYVHPADVGEPSWYYLANVGLLMWLPLPLLLPWLVPRWRRWWQQQDPRVFIPLGWVLLGIACFSIVPAKETGYVLPLLPALVLATAPAMPELLRQQNFRQMLYGLATLTVLLVLTPLIYLAVVDFETLNALLGRYALSEQAIGLLGICALVGIGMLVVFRRNGAVAFIAVVATVWIAYGVGAAPMVNELRSGKVVVKAVQALTDPQRPLGLLGWREQFLLHNERKVVHFGYRRDSVAQEAFDAAAWVAADPTRLLLVSGPSRERCFGNSAAQLVAFAHRRYWFLVDAEDVRGECITRGNPGRAMEYPNARPKLPLS